MPVVPPGNNSVVAASTWAAVAVVRPREFNPSSNAPTSWSWDFGDGASSTEQHPAHVYASAGTFLVRLTASNASGSDEATTVVRVRRVKVLPRAFEQQQQQLERLLRAVAVPLVRIGR